MRIKSIKVNNFRCIESQELDIDDYTVLIGRNGCGKSTFLEALQFFSTPGYRLEDDDFFGRNTSDELTVTVVFADLSEDEKVEFSKYVSGEKLVVERVGKWDVEANSQESLKYHGQRLRHEGFDHIRALRGNQFLTAYRNQRQIEGYESLPVERAEAAARIKLEEWEEENRSLCNLGRDDGQFFGWTNVATGKLDKYAKFIRVPAIMNDSGHWNESSSDSLKFLVDTLVRSAGAGQVLSDLRDRTEEEYTAILGSPDFDLRDVQNEINRCINEFVPQARAVVDWAAKGAVKLPDPTAVVSLDEAGFVGSPKKKGHGLLRAFELAILSLLSDQVGADQDADDQDAIGNLILGIDEPELYQHPAQARVIADRLKQLAGSVVGGYKVTVLSTSHSPLFVTLDNCESIRVVRRGTVGKLSGGAAVWRANLDEMATRLGEVQGQNGFTRETLIPRLSFLFNPRIMECVFADYVVLVEGDEDVAMLDAALGQMDQLQRFRRLGIFVVPVGGKANLDRVILLLQQFVIPHYTVFDGDLNNANVDAEKSANDKIVRLVTGDDQIESPVETDVQQRFAMSEHNLAKAVANEIGTELYTRIRDEIATEHGYPTPKRAMKNPFVVQSVLQRAAQQDRRSRTLAEIVAAIAADAQIELA